jgi:Icc-related predicted phosphoesterase
MNKQTLTIPEFNEMFKIGSPVKFRNEKGEEISSTLRWPAENLEVLKSDTRPVFWVNGRANAVDLTDVIF